MLPAERPRQLHHERRQEARDLVGAHLSRMTLAMEHDVSADPSDVRLPPPPAVMTSAPRHALGREASAVAPRRRAARARTIADRSPPSTKGPARHGSSPPTIGHARSHHKGVAEQAIWWTRFRPREWRA